MAKLHLEEMVKCSPRIRLHLYVYEIKISLLLKPKLWQFHPSPAHQGLATYSPITSESPELWHGFKIKSTYTVLFSSGSHCLSYHSSLWENQWPYWSQYRQPLRYWSDSELWTKIKGTSFIYMHPPTALWMLSPESESIITHNTNLWKVSCK